MRAAAAVLLAAACACGGDRAAEAEQLIELLGLPVGARVGEVGAGSGQMAVIFAQAIGSAGHLYATEIEESKRNDIADAAESAGLDNVTVLEAGEVSSNLPRECCDVIYLRRVYHHFTDAAAINRSIFDALMPGGRLAVIDFEERALLPRPEGVDESRPGHGVPIDLLIEELEAAGFVVDRRIDEWPGDGYCVVARKPQISR